MRTALIILQVLISIVVIISVLLQPSKTDGFNFAGGGIDTFFAKNKTRTREAVLARITVISAIAFAIVTIALSLV